MCLKIPPLLSVCLANLALIGAVGLITPGQTLAVDRGESKPAVPNRVEDFIPAGWTVEQEVSGDLNRDAQTDRVLQIIEPGDSPQRKRSLLVLFGHQSGWQQEALAPNLLLCAGCAGMLSSSTGKHIQLAIADDVLIVQQLAGGRSASSPENALLRNIDRRVKANRNN